MTSHAVGGAYTLDLDQNAAQAMHVPMRTSTTTLILRAFEIISGDVGGVIFTAVNWMWTNI